MGHYDVNIRNMPRATEFPHKILTVFDKTRDPVSWGYQLEVGANVTFTSNPKPSNAASVVGVEDRYASA